MFGIRHCTPISQLKEFKSRDDYRELLELTIIFFGGIPLRGTHFQYPGALGYIVLAGWREPFFHKAGAVSKPVECSEAAGSVPKRFISLLWANSLEPLESVYLLLASMLRPIGFTVHLEQALQGML